MKYLLANFLVERQILRIENHNNNNSYFWSILRLQQIHFGSNKTRKTGLKYFLKKIMKKTKFQINFSFKI